MALNMPQWGLFACTSFMAGVIPPVQIRNLIRGMSIKK